MGRKNPNTRLWRALIESGNATVEDYAKATGMSLRHAAMAITHSRNASKGQNELAPIVMKMREEGMSFFEIGKAIGKTKNAAIGIHHREMQRIQLEGEAAMLAKRQERPQRKAISSASKRAWAPHVPEETPEERDARINAMIWRGVEARRERMAARPSL